MHDRVPSWARRLAALLLAVVAVTAISTASARERASGRLTVQARIPLGGLPSGIAAGAGSIWQIVLNDSSVVRVDPRTNRVVARIRFGPRPSTPVTLSSVGNIQDWVTVGHGFVWVTDVLNRRLVRIDPGTNRVVASTRIDSPWDVATGFGSVWVPQFEPYQLARVDERTTRVVATIPAVGPTSVAIGDGSVWVLAHRAHLVLRISPDGNRLVAKVRLLYPVGPERITFGEGAVWVTDSPNNGVDRIDPATNKTVVFVSLPDSEKSPSPYYLATGGGSVWVVTFGKLLRIDARTNRVTGSFRVDHGKACGTGIAPNPGCFADVVYADGSVWVADTITRTLLRVGTADR